MHRPLKVDKVMRRCLNSESGGVDGCQEFYPSANDVNVCYCGHHACFHEIHVERTSSLDLAPDFVGSAGAGGRVRQHDSQPKEDSYPEEEGGNGSRQERKKARIDEDSLTKGPSESGSEEIALVNSTPCPPLHFTLALEKLQKVYVDSGLLARLSIKLVNREWVVNCGICKTTSAVGPHKTLSNFERHLASKRHMQTLQKVEFALKREEGERDAQEKATRKTTLRQMSDWVESHSQEGIALVGEESWHCQMCNTGPSRFVNGESNIKQHIRSACHLEAKKSTTS
eukprot:TRINITY_DN2105_c0_g2_i2.p1 TRINITY_DN2105_c0_g2~~TRINITY_DN2105_c0_g2_i2.p1  ORF type:complete len:284 (-),score=37.94 TRINITY_DN2105_c0_g2_i2:912-1763(-)